MVKLFDGQDESPPKIDKENEDSQIYLQSGENLTLGSNYGMIFSHFNINRSPLLFAI
jgi:hypothetical protein